AYGVFSRRRCFRGQRASRLGHFKEWRTSAGPCSESPYGRWTFPRYSMDGYTNRTYSVCRNQGGLMARVCMVLFNDYVSDARAQREAEALVQRGDSVDCICLCRQQLNSLHAVQLFHLSGTKYRGASRLQLLFRYVQFFCYAFFKLALEHLRFPYDVVQVHTMPDFLIFTALIPKL